MSEEVAQHDLGSGISDLGSKKRTLSALQVSALVPYKKREVLLWPGRGCPHAMGVRRGKPSASFNIDEVRAWLISKGMDVVMPAASTSESGAGDGDGGDGGAGGADGGWEEGDTIWGAAQDDAVARVGDMDSRVRQLSLKIDDLSRKKVSDPAAAQRMAAALKPLMTELRALELHRIEMKRTRGELVERRLAAELLCDLAATLTAALEALVIDLPQAMWLGVGEKPLADVEHFTRRAAVVVERAVAEVREQIASTFEAKARALCGGFASGKDEGGAGGGEVAVGVGVGVGVGVAA